ncbi:alpha/beta hydrolase [Jatrophihabitans sp. YIM 134969]
MGEPAPETVSFHSHGVRCEAWWLPAVGDGLRVDAQGNDRGAPCVVMAHGFAASRDTGLLPFARRFAAAGMHVLVFDYRGFGTSEGEPRQDVDHRKHRQDYHAALAFVRGRSGVDPDRVAIWGSSYSGGHVVVVAKQDPRVAAVVSQGAAMDGLKALFGNSTSEGSGKALRMVGHVARDVLAAVTRRPPHGVAVVGEPGSDAVITGEDAESGYLTLAGPTFRNEMCARGLLRVGFNRPVLAGKDVRVPALVVIAERDNVAPPSAVHEAARRMPHAETLAFDCNHFDIYVGDVFEQSVARQVEFLSGALAP